MQGPCGHARQVQRRRRRGQHAGHVRRRGSSAAGGRPAGAREQAWAHGRQPAYEHAGAGVQATRRFGLRARGSGTRRPVRAAGAQVLASMLGQVNMLQRVLVNCCSAHEAAT
nr:unnamed protein product [Digitaria exilis]